MRVLNFLYLRTSLRLLYSQSIFILTFLLLGALGCETTDNIVSEIETIGSLQGEVQSIGIPIQVRLLKDGQPVEQSETDGSYELNEIEAGNYTLHISADGYQEAELNVTVIAGETVLLDKVTLVLLPGQGLSIGSQAPAFELPDGEGAFHTLADYIGNNKKVIIVFYRGGW